MPLYGIVFIVMMLDGLVETTVCLYEGQDFYSLQNDLFLEKFLKESALSPFNVRYDTATLDFCLLEFSYSYAQKRL